MSHQEKFVGERTLPEITPWYAYGHKLRQDATLLAVMQTDEDRDITGEQAVANRTRDEITRRGRIGSEGWVPAVHVEARKIYVARDFHPLTLDGQRQLYHLGRTRNPRKLDYALREHDESLASTYLGSFQLGKDLGYGDELGDDRWHLTLGDNEHQFYIPVEGIERIEGIYF